MTLHGPSKTTEVVRIGINNSPPYVIIARDGSYSGFTVEVLSEAARRRGMAIQWVVVPEGPDFALKSGKVDVWHLLTDLPERRRWAYYTDPWMRTQFVLAVRENGAVKSVGDAAGRRVSYTNTPLQGRNARTFLPQSSLMAEEAGLELMALCRGSADAAFIDMKHLIPRLLHPSEVCASFPLEIITVDGASFQMAIGATRKGFGKARELRAEITHMAEDLTLDALYRKWLRHTSDETRIVNELTEARQRSRLFRYCAAILGALVVLLAVLIYRERTVRQAVKSAYEFAEAALDAAGGLVFITDRYGRIVRLNRACERITGKTFEEARNRTSWEVFVPPEERAEVQKLFAALAGGISHSDHEYHWQTREGPRLFSWSNTVLLNKAGRVEYIIATGIDISNREAAERKLDYEASHDALTNIANRRRFMRELDTAFAAAQAGGAGFSLALADLDRFKAINDVYGHQAGDEVLSYVARLLRSEVGGEGLAGRLGGDEFCIVIQSGQVEPTLKRIRDRLRAHEFRAASGKTFHASLTFGCATWCESLQHPSDLLRTADQDLYLAKASGSNRLSRFEVDIAALKAELDGKVPPARSTSRARK
jgi:diguanylate cyclase (GGDEF)-like protein/PAS domain S-box-containing protein